MRRSPLQALASSPTMVGAITTLIVIVAVFLAYNANNGLPFVPTYRVSLEVPNAARIVDNNEVRIGGSRVGVVESIEAVRPEGDQTQTAQASGSDASGSSKSTSTQQPGEVVAKLNLKLDKSVQPLPENSIFRIRYKSAFGLKYLEITRGDGPAAPEGFTFNGVDDTDDPNDTDNIVLSPDEVKSNQNADNGTFIAQTEFDEIGNTFDQRTRNAGRTNLIGFGDGLAGRGASLNLAIQSLNPLLVNLKPVADALVDPNTRFARFFPALGKFAGIVAPVARQNAELFGNMATTFGAISRDPEALKATISQGPPTLETGIRTLPAQRVFLANFTDLGNRLKPGVRQLRLALPDLNDAIVTGTPVLKRTVQTSGLLQNVFVQLRDLVQQPTTLTSLNRLQDTFDSAKPLAKYIAPVQTVCNYWNYFWTYLPEHLSERDSVAFTQRVSLISTPQGSLTLDPGLGTPITVPGEAQTGLSSAGYSGRQANGRAADPADPNGPGGEFQPRDLPILHGNPTGPTGQNGEGCQSGQTGYLLGRAPIAGQSPANPAVAKPNLPGNQGPTTVFFNQDGTRTFKDTRVKSRQPDGS